MDVDKLTTLVKDIYNELLLINDGEVADYIPQLAEVNADLFGTLAFDNSI